MKGCYPLSLAFRIRKNVKKISGVRYRFSMGRPGSGQNHSEFAWRFSRRLPSLVCWGLIITDCKWQSVLTNKRPSQLFSNSDKVFLLYVYLLLYRTDYCWLLMVVSPALAVKVWDWAPGVAEKSSMVQLGGKESAWGGKSITHTVVFLIKPSLIIIKNHQWSLLKILNDT